MQVLKHLGLVPSQNSYNGRNMRGSAHTLPTSRETGHTVQNRQTKVSSEHIIFTHAYMCHMTSEFTISPTLCTDVKCHYYFVCCRDDTYRRNEKPRITTKKRHHQKSSHKLNATCLSRMYVDDLIDKSVTLTYIPAHTGHKPTLRDTSFYHYPRVLMREFPFSSHKEFQQSGSFKVKNLGVVYKWYSSITLAIAYTTCIF